jgi:formylglycine-generating enzyme
MRLRAVALASLATLVACAAAPPGPAESPVPPPPPSATAGVAAPVDSGEPPPPASASASAAPATSASAVVKAPDGPTHCPAGMKLVEGEYCSEVEHKCKKEWFDKSNKKVICEEFEPHATCTGTKTKKRYCIDEYSWPNVKGERPEVMNNFYQAQVKCASVGKRMCTESEWTLACEGPEMKPFPYGWARDSTKCNGDHMWDEPKMKKVAQRDPKELARLWKGVPNGAQPECVSDYGIADLPGNTDDVVANESWDRGGMYGKFESVHTGGPWYKGTRNQCRPKIYTHDEGFYYYFLGFRCCGGPDGAENDPRTPHQVKEDIPFKKVESLARFGVAEMKKKLELKQENKCTCSAKDILCKTMCGILVGEDAKDIDLKAPRE